MTDNWRRWLEPRAEERCETRLRTAVLKHHGRSHVVGLINVSSAGVMIDFNGDLTEGDAVAVQLFDQGEAKGACAGSRRRAEYSEIRGSVLAQDEVLMIKAHIENALASDLRRSAARRLNGCSRS